MYDEIVRWRRNIFLLPSGQAGKSFLEEMTRLAKAWASKSKDEAVAMTMLMVMPALLLQKPSKRSKTAEHVAALKRRLQDWKEDKIEDLIREGRAIQNRLQRSKHSQHSAEKVFVRLMLQGKISAAMRWIGESSTGILDANHETMTELIKKHPTAKPAEYGSVLKGPEIKVEPIIFSNIDGKLIQASAKRTAGAAGPSGLDSDGWKRMLCSKQFGKKTDELCDAIASMAQRLCTSYIDPVLLQPYVACRLIPLDKKPGVRPVGIGEVLRRVIGKAVMTVLQRDMVRATAPLQVCAGIPGGVEAAVHAARQFFEHRDTEALILVDAENAFNSLNRDAALSNIRLLCPELASYVINTYREPARLFVYNGDKEILSEEGVTQGDNAAMGFYACATIPVIAASRRQEEEEFEDNQVIDDREAGADVSNVKQIRYADDAAGGGKINSLSKWWKNLCKSEEQTHVWILSKTLKDMGDSQAGARRTGKEGFSQPPSYYDWSAIPWELHWDQTGNVGVC